MRRMSLALMLSLVPMAACGDDESIEFPTEPLSVDRGFRASRIEPGRDDEPSTSPINFVWASTPEVHITIEELVAFVDGTAPTDVQEDAIEFGEERPFPNGAAISCFNFDPLFGPQLWPRQGLAVCLEVPAEVTAQVDIQITETDTRIRGLPSGSVIAFVQNAAAGSTVGSCFDFIEDDRCLVGTCQVPDCN